MKKAVIIIIFSFVFTCMLFSEHIFSINVGFNVGDEKIIKDDNLYNVNDSTIVAGAEYNYLFPFNLYTGGFIQIGYNNFNTWLLNDDININANGIKFLFAPVIGYKIGHKNFFSIGVIPVYFEYALLNGTNKYYERTYNGNYYSYYSQKTETISFKNGIFGSGLRLNFQWGKNSTTYGFSVAGYLPWYFGMYDLDLKQYEDTKITSSANGFKFELCYRMSFCK